MPPTVETIAWLETPLWVDRAVAGMSYAITLGSRRVRLTLPLENVGEVIHSTHGSSPPTPPFPGRRRPAPLRTSYAETGSAQVIPAGLLVVTAVWLRIPADGDLAVESYTTWPIRTVASAFGTWLARAEAWLDAWTSAVRQPVTRTGTPRIRAAIRTEDGSLAGVSTGGPVPVVIRGQRWATPDEVTAGFAAASGGLDIPLAHAVLRRSLVELHSGEYRLCVIDACSAAEIALGAALTTRLHARGLEEGEIERLIGLTSGISQAFSLYHDLVMGGQSAVSKSQIADKLAKPRNRSVHAADHPDEAVARRALETAAPLVLEAIRLPSPTAVLTETRARSRQLRAAASA